MARQTTHEERQLIKLIQNAPFTEELKTNWVERLETQGLEEELVEEIRNELTTLGSVQGREGMELVQISANYTRIIRQWRLTRQTQSFKKRSDGM